MQMSLSRVRLVRWLVALPAIAGALTVIVLESAVLRSTWDGSSQPPVGSLAHALRRGDLDSALFFIRSGQDPNNPIEFRDQILTGDRAVMVSPMLIAVASNNDDAVMMLMSFGARLDAPGNRFAGCLADRLGHQGIARILATYGGPAGSQDACPDTVPDSSAPLNAFSSGTP